jgi:hypothetical protein
MLPHTRYLARLIGLYLAIVGICMMLDKSRTIETIDAALKSQGQILIFGVIGSLAGAALVLGHQEWHGGFVPVAVTAIGWVLLAKGVLLLALPLEETARLTGLLRYESGFYYYLGFATGLGLLLLSASLFHTTRQRSP